MLILETGTRTRPTSNGMKNNIKIVYLAGFLLSMPIALTSYINSSLIGSYINASYLGVIYIIASIFTIWGMLNISKLLKETGNRMATMAFSVFYVLSLLTMALSHTGFVIVLAFIVSFIMYNLIIANMDIFVEEYSNTRNTGRIRGMYLSITNLAWVASQLISGSIIRKSSFMGIYSLSALFTLLAFIVLYLYLKDFKDPEYKKVSVLKTLKSFIKNKHLSKVYLINLILKFFYSWMIIYTPIYLHQYMMFTWDKIGLIFSIMLLPFVILDYPLGRISDKMGEKTLLLVGFSIIALSTIIIPFIKTDIFIVWALVLLSTRVGAATIETMSESYFFKCIDSKDADSASFFRNTTPLSFILGPALAIPVLIFVPSFSYLFFVLGAILIGGLLLTLRLEDVK